MLQGKKTMFVYVVLTPTISWHKLNQKSDKSSRMEIKHAGMGVCEWLWILLRKCDTLPKTNIAPENRPSQKETCLPTSNHPFSGAMLDSGRVSFKKLYKRHLGSKTKATATIVGCTTLNCTSHLVQDKILDYFFLTLHHHQGRCGCYGVKQLEVSYNSSCFTNMDFPEIAGEFPS